MPKKVKYPKIPAESNKTTHSAIKFGCRNSAVTDCKFNG